jgi:hypothetical protein
MSGRIPNTQAKSVPELQEALRSTKNRMKFQQQVAKELRDLTIDDVPTGAQMRAVVGKIAEALSGVREEG